MSHVKEQLQRNARACLSATWDHPIRTTNRELQAAFACGWRGGMGEGISYTDADEVMTHVEVGKRISRELAEAIIAELEGAGIRLQRDRNANYSISPGHFRATELPQSIDHPYVEGFAITITGDTFREQLLPLLAGWRTHEQGAVAGK